MNYQGIEYDAILVRGNPRFRANKKMVAADSVPIEVRAALVAELQAPKPAVIPPSPAEVQASQDAPLQEAGIQPIEEVSEKDFTDNPAPVVAPAPLANDVTAATATGLPSQYEMDLISQLEDVKQELANRQATKLDLFGLAKEMYEQYGIYTVFVGAPPKDGDAHPFNGQVMTRYELGLAYQQFNRVQAQGLLKVNFEEQHTSMKRSELARDIHQREMDDRKQGTYSDGYSSFDERTSVQGQNAQSSAIPRAHTNDPISEDATVEPNLRGQTIRPTW